MNPGATTNLRAIVVDDMLLSRMTSEKLLKQLGFKSVTQAVDGEDAWNKLQEAHQTNQPYHLIVTDWMMPVLDGLGLIQRIKASAWAQLPKIILATAESDVGQVAQAVKIGIHAYVRKPLTIETFEEAVSRALDEQKDSP